MTDRSKLLALAGEVANGEGLDNGLDVRVEVALFNPTPSWASIRANDAGTKVIYTDFDGRDTTCWAPEWTGMRGQAAIDLRAQAEALS
ncbi:MULTISPECIES: hypothetical protein [unclassified Sphingomonas]|uniref:hypothetical protein n=1 Tax=unclassified Sphingomonas TaxID=196159 RepID=UPI0006FB067D|nr:MULTISPECIES: hypothetical protein [unclassified Sphingomonas]KQM62397.1 hypothetical protein ASE65_05270 [Sphingomonas sp. Leaf16]KQN13800.1 hypothetical protein ASE81_05340 [Sphingomonas sp. Leaf29]KQN22971.1 hypothetical protein ASE83_00070 [Sphingomonas sp. Leaf32]